MAKQGTPVEQVPHRPLGVVPASPKSRLLWAWALATFVLTMLPVWDIFANDARLVAGFLPATVLWSYAVFGVVNLIAITIYATVARDWVDRTERRPDLVEPHAELSRRQKVLLDLTEHKQRYAEGEVGQ